MPGFSDNFFCKLLLIVFCACFFVFGFGQNMDVFAAAPTGGVIGYWSFDEGTGETAKDSAGKHNGTLTKGPVWKPGKIGTAISFDGKDDYINVANPADGSLNPKYISISAWINIASIDGKYHYIVSKNSDIKALGGYELRITPDGALGGGVWGNSSSTRIWAISKDKLAVKTWYFVTMTFDGTNIKLYLNGVLAPTTTNVSNVSNETIMPGNCPLRIGALAYSADNKLWYLFNGLIDEVRIYNRALTPTEVFLAYGAAAPSLLQLAKDKKTAYVIVVDKNASPAEKHAADELATFLKEVTGTDFPRLTVEEANKRYGNTPRIAVGPGAAKATAPGLSLNGLKEDGIVIQALSPSPNIILTGGVTKGVNAPRGTLYAVYTFLEDMVGCRWWTPTADTIPKKPTLDIPVVALNVRYVPLFERRDQGFYEGLSYKENLSKEAVQLCKEWGVHMKYNGQTGPGNDDEKYGGVLSYANSKMAHTFYQLVPPDVYFGNHPEWYSYLINDKHVGKRTYESAQLCLANADTKGLTETVIKNGKKWLKEDSKATFLSITQNDGYGHCQCSACQNSDANEGSPAGTMLQFVNKIADAFPNVAVDTFAYLYTRKPPKTAPHSNVVVRLCSIECDFAHPLDGTGDKDTDVNKEFREDFKGWTDISKQNGSRLYIWDYVTNFSNYIQPHPNLRVLGPNVRYFAKMGVKGVFEQGNSQSPGGEFGALRAWMLGKLLWNPKLDDNALIDEFLDGYYGAAAPFIRSYIDTLHDRVKETGVKMFVRMPVKAPYLDFKTMMTGEKLFQDAEKAVANDEKLLNRVRIAHLPVRYVFISRWSMFKQAAARTYTDWQWFDNAKRDDVITEFEDLCTKNNITYLAEAAKPNIATLRTDFGGRREDASLPPNSIDGKFNNKELDKTNWIDFQDDLFPPLRRGKWGDLIPSQPASDGKAAWIYGKTANNAWAVQFLLNEPDLPLQGQKWTAYVVLRVNKNKVMSNKDVMFSSGIYNTKGGKDNKGAYVVNIDVYASGNSERNGDPDCKDQTYKLGDDLTLTPDMYLWAALSGNNSVEGIAIDRFFLVKKK